MNTTLSIQELLLYTRLAFSLFLLFAGISFYLLVRLLTNQAILIKARAKIKEYADHLEDMVQERTKDLQQALRKLQIGEARYSAIISNASAGIGMMDKDGGIIHCNNKFAKMLGFDDCEQLSNRSFWELAQQMDKTESLEKFESMIKGEIDFYGFEKQYNRNDGKTFWGDISVTPVVGEGKDVEAAIFVVSDITGLKKSEEEIRLLSKQVINAEESERQKIASDLHDDVAQNLYAAVMACENMYKIKSEESVDYQKDLIKLRDMISKSLKSVREVSYNLKPSGLDRLGLALAVEELVENFSNNYDMDIDFQSIGMQAVKLDFDIEINIYRIIQESLNNIKKHAEANKIVIKLISVFPNIILRIEDDGKGFKVVERRIEAAEEKRMGLYGMESRVKALKGEFDIKSSKGSGTKIIVKVPQYASRIQ